MFLNLIRVFWMMMKTNSFISLFLSFIERVLWEDPGAWEKGEGVSRGRKLDMDIGFLMYECPMLSS